MLKIDKEFEEDYLNGKMSKAYKYLGCHLDGSGANFAIYAPYATKVCVIGEFNDWNDTEMVKDSNGFFSIYINNVYEGQMYKYKIYKGNAGIMDHCDPYGTQMELRPACASIIVNDKNFTEERNSGNIEKNTEVCLEKMLENAYCIDSDKWKKEDGNFYSYSEMSQLILNETKNNNIKCIVFSQLCEYSVDESKGLAPTCFYAPTKRYGSNLELKDMIHDLKANGLTIIMEYSPVYFADEYYALPYLDSTELYGSHNDNGSKCCNSSVSKFNYQKGIVKSFLFSNISYWIEKFGFDGIKLINHDKIVYYNDSKESGIDEAGLLFFDELKIFMDENFPGKLITFEDVSHFDVRDDDNKNEEEYIEQEAEKLQIDNSEKWYEKSVFYHIYPLGFCDAPEYNENEKTKGDRILSILDWIPHFKRLGINALYMGPIFESGWHGYDTNNYYEIDSRLGTWEDMKVVAQALHDNGIRLVFDGVFNHVGRGFAPFKDVIEKRENSRYKDWFSGINFGGQSGFNDGFSYDTWAGNWELVKLNLKNPEVVDHLLGAVKKWIDDFNIDGLRLDAADCIDKEYFKKLKCFTKQIKPDFWLMGEIIHGDYNMWANNDMMDSVTNYECWKGIYSSHNDKNYFEIAHSLKRQFGKGGIYENLKLYNFVDNHDVNRIATLLNDKKNIANAYTLMFFMPGIPSIYYGSEWGIEGKKTFGKEADKPIRPSMAAIQAGEKGNIDGNLSGMIGQLSQIRKTSNALAYGTYQDVLIRNEQFVFARVYKDETAIAAFNISEEKYDFSFEFNGKKYNFEVEAHGNAVFF